MARPSAEQLARRSETRKAGRTAEAGRGGDSGNRNKWNSYTSATDARRRFFAETFHSRNGTEFQEIPLPENSVPLGVRRLGQRHPGLRHLRAGSSSSCP